MKILKNVYEDASDQSLSFVEYEVGKREPFNLI